MWKKLLVCFLALMLLTGTALTVANEYTPVAAAEQAAQTLPAPTLKTLKATSGGMQITWSAVEGATKYQIWRSTKHNSGFARIITVTGTSYVDKTAKMNKAYYYYIRPVNAAGAGAKSNVKGHYRAFGPKITSTMKNGSLVLSWKAPAGATSYSLYRAEPGSSTYKRLTTQQATTYTDKAVKGGQSYSYYVIANYKLATGKTVTGNKGDAKSVWYGVNPVETVTATNATGGVKLTWTKRTNAKQYIIMYSTDGTNFKQIATVDGSKLTYTHTAPAWGKTVTYGVRAIFKGNGATYYATATRASVVALKMPVLTLKVEGSNLITASWSKVTGANGYNLFYRVQGASSYAKVELDNSKSSYALKTQSGKTYEVYVRAVVRGETGTVKYASEKSTVKKALATGEKVQGKPTITNVLVSGQSLYFEWNVSDSSFVPEGYNVYLYNYAEQCIRIERTYSEGHAFWIDEPDTYYVSVRAYRKVYDYDQGQYVTEWGTMSAKRKVSIPKFEEFKASGLKVQVLDSDTLEVSWKENRRDYDRCEYSIDNADECFNDFTYDSRYDSATGRVIVPVKIWEDEYYYRLAIWVYYDKDGYYQSICYTAQFRVDNGVVTIVNDLSRYF